MTTEERCEAKRQISMTVGKDVNEAIVLGGGIAGLAAAWELRDRDVLVLEAEDRVGGRIKSIPRGHYWLNVGAHVFGGAGSATARLLDATGVTAGDVPGVLTGLAFKGKILRTGRVETYPFRLPLRWRDRWTLARAGIRLRLAVSEYGRMSRPREGESAEERRTRIMSFRGDETFSDFLGDVPEDVDAMFRPTINRSSGEPEEVTAGYGIGYFQLVWDRQAGLARNIFGGSSQLPEAIARTLGDRVHLRCPVKEVTTEDDRVRVCYAQDGVPHERLARYVVAATPAYVTRRIIPGLAPKTREALEAISYGPYVVAAFLTRETSPAPWDDLYAVATPKKSFNMMFNMANILRPKSDTRQPGGSLMVYSGAGLARRLADLDDNQIAKRYVEDLSSVFPQIADIVEEVYIQRWEHGLPHPRPGRHRVQAALECPLGRIFLAGDYLGTTYTETAIETGTSAASAIRLALEAPP